MSLILASVVFALAAQAGAVPVSADGEHPQDGDRAAAYFDPAAVAATDTVVVTSGGFGNAHPDLRYRLLGTDAQGKGRHEEARRHFRTASRYADKLSQAAYAEMLWEGRGGDADRALAYAWMDLAAERGAPLFVALRERYWGRLDAALRAQALHAGQDVYAEYGDKVAKPRLEALLRKARNNVTGSRLGFVGPMDICLEGDCQRGRVRGDRYYADRYWKSEQYWRWQDELVRTPQRDGTVEVGPVENAPAPAGP